MRLLIQPFLSDAIVDLVRNTNHIVLVSPYLWVKEWEDFYSALKHSADQGATIEVHTNKIDNNHAISEADVLSKFSDIVLANIYLHKDLHAKIYFNEKNAIITSLNLIGKSAHVNIEIGYATETEDEYNQLLSAFYYPKLIHYHETHRIKNQKIQLAFELKKQSKQFEFAIFYHDNNELLIDYDDYSIRFYSMEDDLLDAKRKKNKKYYSLFFNLNFDQKISHDKKESVQKKLGTKYKYEETDCTFTLCKCTPWYSTLTEFLSSESKQAEVITIICTIVESMNSSENLQ